MRKLLMLAGLAACLSLAACEQSKSEATEAQPAPKKSLSRPAALYAGQDQIMLSLSQEDGQTPGQLASKLGVRPPTITKTINRLQVQGFLDKRASETDARQAHVFLTDTGRDAIRSIEKSVRKTEKQALKGLDKKDQKALSKLLWRIEANLSDAVPHELEDELDTEE